MMMKLKVAFALLFHSVVTCYAAQDNDVELSNSQGRKCVREARNDSKFAVKKAKKSRKPLDLCNISVQAPHEKAFLIKEGIASSQGDVNKTLKKASILSSFPKDIGCIIPSPSGASQLYAISLVDTVSDGVFEAQSKVDALRSLLSDQVLAVPDEITGGKKHIAGDL